MNYQKLLCGLFLVLTSISANSQILAEVKNAYFYRDYQKVEKIIRELKQKNHLNVSLNPEAELLAIAVDIQQDDDEAQDKLITFLQDNPTNAEAHYMAGLLWIKIAKKASIFTKMSNYKRYVSAMIKAAALAPDNERYQMEAAKAYAQPSMMGGDISKQKPIVDKLMENNSAFAQISMMDHLQNTQNEKESFSMINRMSVEFKNDIEVLERAAQLLWTFDKKQQAGVLFTQVCNLPPGKKEAFIKWTDACLLSAYFTLDDKGNLDLGLNSINRLLKHNVVDDEESRYALSVKEKLLAIYPR
ncbi:MAG: hypothetical protein HRT37_22985 [Alteromonadaceae bacterium]|nr:hypothetical protein [Alteromonadaceae bacterium]